MPFFSTLQIDSLNFKRLIFGDEHGLKRKLKASNCCLRATWSHQQIKIYSLLKPMHGLSIKPILCFDTETRCLSMRISYSLGSTILNFWVLNLMLPFISKIIEKQFSNDCLIQEVPMLWFSHCPLKWVLTSAPTPLYDCLAFAVVESSPPHASIIFVQSMKDL